MKILIGGRGMGCTILANNLARRLSDEPRPRAEELVEELVANCNLENLVHLARLVGLAQDAVTDDMIGRLARMASESMVLTDRLTRSDGFLRLISLMERPDIQDSLAALLEAVAEARNAAPQAPSKDGIGGAVRLMSEPGTQDTLRLMAGISKALAPRWKSCRGGHLPRQNRQVGGPATWPRKSLRASTKTPGAASFAMARGRVRPAPRRQRADAPLLP